MAIKHNTVRWKLKKYATGCFSRQILRYLGPKKSVLSRIICCITWKRVIKGVLSSFSFVPMQGASSKDRVDFQIAYKGTICAYF